MNITAKPFPFVRIRHNDPRFKMTNGIVVCDVAGIEITKDCPDSYASIIADAMERGWLVPFAMIKREMDYCI